DDLATHAGELFGRVTTPWNVFAKGFVGGGKIVGGHMNDEDFGIPLLTFFAPYSNTVAAAVTGSNRYWVADGGYDVLRAAGCKVGVFAGYFWWKSGMNAFGCAPVASFNCFSNVPPSGAPSITEHDTWKGARVGVEGEMMLNDKVRLNGEVAYLPSVDFTG